MVESPLFYLNHIVLLYSWAYFHHSYFRDRSGVNLLKLYAILLINFVGVMFLVHKLSILSGNNLFRTVVTLIELFFILKLFFRQSWLTTFRAILFHYLVSLVAEMLSILTMLALRGFNQAAFQDASFFAPWGFLFMDLYTTLLFLLILRIRKRSFPEMDWKQQGPVLLLMVLQGAWVYLLSYHVIADYEISWNLTFFLILTLIAIQIVSLFLIFGMIQLSRQRNREKRQRQHTCLVQQQLQQLNEKQELMSELFQCISLQTCGLSVAAIQTLHDQLKDQRYPQYCDNPSVNAMLVSMQQQMQNSQIKVNYAITASLSHGFDDYDLNTLLSNILKNAMEEAEESENPFVSLSITRRNAIFLIRCENSRSLNRRHRKKRISGNGFVIIREILNRYHGEISLSLDHQKAVAEALMMARE